MKRSSKSFDGEIFHSLLAVPCANFDGGYVLDPDYRIVEIPICETGKHDMRVRDATDLPLQSRSITQMDRNAGRRIHRLLQRILEAEFRV